MDEVREKHRDELARERQRLEARFKETALTDLRREVTDEIETELRVELVEAQKFHDDEVQILKEKYEEMIKQERLANMPR